MKIGAKLIAGRQKMGFTQQEVADKLFVTRQTVLQWENDQRKPDLEAVASLCRLLKLDARELLNVKQTDVNTMNELLGVPTMLDIAGNIKIRPAYMRAVIGGGVFPKTTPPRWFNRLVAGYQMAVGTVEFGDEVTLKDEHDQIFYQSLPTRMTVALLNTLIYPGVGVVPVPEVRYRTLITIDHMNLLIPTPTVVPAFLDWAQTHNVMLQDPMRLANHQNIDFKALTAAQFNKLAAGTPYEILYQQAGGSMAPW